MAESTPHPDARFIPREELKGYAAWRPGSFGDAPGVARPVAATPDLQATTAAARQAGYQDGYRDGLVALEAFKQSFASQMAAQMGQLVTNFDAEFAALESQIADAVAHTATALARQVVRSELATRPELVAAVAAQAVEAVLLSARHVRVNVNSQDHALVAEGAAEVLAARGARLVADPSVARGGCVVESDLGRIDASIEARWAQAADQLGQPLGMRDDVIVRGDVA
jgi:flagellar assembly protein FliH